MQPTSFYEISLTFEGNRCRLLQWIEEFNIRLCIIRLRGLRVSNNSFSLAHAHTLGASIIYSETLLFPMSRDNYITTSASCPCGKLITTDINSLIWWNLISFWMDTQLMQWHPLFIVWRLNGLVVNRWRNWRNSLTGTSTYNKSLYSTFCCSCHSPRISNLTGKCLR